MKYVAAEINKSEGREEVLDKAEVVLAFDLGEDDYLEEPSARIHYNSKENMIDYISIEGFQQPVNCIIIDENTRFYKEDSKDDYERIWNKDYNVDFHKEI